MIVRVEIILDNSHQSEDINLPDRSDPRDIENVAGALAKKIAVGMTAWKRQAAADAKEWGSR